MTRHDPEGVRRRVLQAASGEFARFGLAGARVDAIAAAAEANKQRLYANFGGKEQLFERVVGDSIVGWLTAVPFTADDLPGYAAALDAHFLDHPDDARLLMWGQLSAASAGRIPPEADRLLQERGQEVAELQAAGRITSDWAAPELLALIFAVIAGRAINPTLPLGGRLDDRDRRERARAVEQAVRRLIAPAQPA